MRQERGGERKGKKCIREERFEEGKVKYVERRQDCRRGEGKGRQERTTKVKGGKREEGEEMGREGDRIQKRTRLEGRGQGKVEGVWNGRGKEKREDKLN